MGRSYAHVGDVISLKKSLTDEQITRADALIVVVSAQLRFEADKRGKDLDELVDADSDYAAIVRSVVVDVVMRELQSPLNQEPATQVSQSALGYSISYSPLVPGGGILIKRTELARLGLNRQRVGVLEPYAY